MPGGTNYRQWYAMRKAMQQRGTWRGRPPTHSVPQQEEGEPPAQRRREDRWYERTLAGQDLPQPSDEDPGVSSGQESDSIPELESSPTAEGNGVRRILHSYLGQSKLTHAISCNG